MCFTNQVESQPITAKDDPFVLGKKQYYSLIINIYLIKILEHILLIENSKNPGNQLL